MASDEGFSQNLDDCPMDEGKRMNEDEEDDDEDEETWDEMHAECESYLSCLFCSQNFKTMAVALEHCKIDHNFNLTNLKNKFNMDCYSYICMINYVRKEGVSPEHLLSLKEPVWLNGEYLQPVIQDDPWLMFGSTAADSDEINKANEVGAHVDAQAFDIKMKFSENLNSLLQRKANNSELFTREKYLELISDVKEARTKLKKKAVDYRRLKKYDIIAIKGKEKLIAPLTKDKTRILYYVSTEELFDIVHNAHLKTGHGGRTRMEKELQNQYKNVTKEVIMMYLRLCKPCQLKLSKQKKGLVFKEFNSRCQVDLIDMQTNPDGEYKFILNYQDHLTKFILLRPLKSEKAEEVAYHLLDIFTTIGAPSVLQSDNGREFANHVVNELKRIWPELKLVHGKPIQGSVEHGNEDILNMIATLTDTNEPVHWAQSLRFIQFLKNRSYHPAIQKSPYEAMFGCKAKIGLSTSSLPKEVVDNLFTDEDLELAEQKMRDALNLGDVSGKDSVGDVKAKDEMI